MRGQVQGVGFRPFVYRLAIKHGVHGLVRNDEQGAVIEAFGPAARLEAMLTELRTTAPTLARIDSLNCTAIPVAEVTGFHIAASAATGRAGADVTVDTAVCPDCLSELLNPLDRRHRHALINCTACGPRYSIVIRVPYDRIHTTMARFDMCAACAAEYRDPADRRYHAQPICCHQCGPRHELVGGDGTPISGDPFAVAARRLADGDVLAIKGLGGFHLAVRADRDGPVRKLRERKHRAAKPLAVMCATAAAARQLVALSDHGDELLRSPAAPVVLAARHPDCALPDAVAPGNHRLGVMLPYTPIQHLLLADPRLRGVPLVMTSANFSEEPLVHTNGDALTRLGPLCDAILWHDRDIHRPVDDSVLLDDHELAPLPIRRARGYVPAPLEMPEGTAPCADGIAVGGDLKSTVAVVSAGRVILSQHLGDLSTLNSFRSFQRTIEDLIALFGVDPAWIAHDLHPDYRSAGHARRLAKRLGVPLIGVQHHHAHAAAVLGEHGVTGHCLAIVCDGTGYGLDQTIWGGELLWCDYADFVRLVRLRPIPLLGGDKAAIQIARCGLAVLAETLGAGFIAHPVAAWLEPDPAARRRFAQMLARGVNTPLSSGTGRLFDAVASLLRVADVNRFEGEAPVALEAAAHRAAYEAIGFEPFEVGPDPAAPRVRMLNPAPFVRWLLEQIDRGTPVELLAAAFHEALAEAWARAAVEAADATGSRRVALTGGVFCNARLTRSLTARLKRAGLEVLRHEHVPPNDGGLSFGQAVVAAARTRADPSRTG